MGVSLNVGSHHTKPRFSLWLRQDANTIRNQYRDLLVSWGRVLLLVRPLCLNSSRGHCC